MTEADVGVVGVHMSPVLFLAATFSGLTLTGEQSGGEIDLQIIFFFILLRLFDTSENKKLSEKVFRKPYTNIDT